MSGGSISAQGLLDVEATGAETIQAIGAAGSAAIAGGGAAGVAVAGAGADDSNAVTVGVSAYVQSDTVASLGATIKAADTSQITAKVLAASVAAAIGGAAGVAVAIGISVAENTIADPVLAYVTGVSSMAEGGGAVTISANSSATIVATSLAAAVALAGGGAAGVAVAGGGAIALNTITVDTEAHITGSTLTGVGLGHVTSTEGGSITATIAAVAGSVAVGGGAGVAAAIGIAYAQNNLVSSAGGGVFADVVGSSVSGAGSLSLSATSSEAITAQVLAGGIALAGGGAAGVAVTFAGSFGYNTIAVATRAYVDGQGVATIATTGGLSVTTSDTSHIAALVGAATIGGAIGGAAGVAVSIGLAIAQNSIEGDQEAYVANVKSIALNGGGLTVQTTEQATIDADTVAAALSISGGYFAGVSVAAAGAVAQNAIRVDVDSHIANSTIASAGAITVTPPPTTTNIWALIDSASASAGFGIAGVGVAVGIAIANNAIADGSTSGANAGTLTAYVLETPIQASGALSVGTTSNNNIFAQVGASRRRCRAASSGSRRRARARRPTTPSTSPAPPTSRTPRRRRLATALEARPSRA